MPQAPKTLNTFESIFQVIKDLRGTGGCPWDKEQTHTTLAPYAIEEVHEMVEAIENGQDAPLCEELGDVLFQVVLHAEIASERGAFNISDVIFSIVSKIVRRHPHVFSDTKVNDSAEVIRNWEEIKKSEKKNKVSKNRFFDIPPSLPALQTAHKIGEKTENYKFDWTEPRQVLEQLKAEVAELEQAMNEPNSEIKQQHIKHELGDVLFSAAQLARHLNSEPETDLRDSNRRFIKRFEKMVSSAGSIEKFSELSSLEKEKLWNRAKQDN